MTPLAANLHAVRDAFDKIEKRISKVSLDEIGPTSRRAILTAIADGRSGAQSAFDWLGAHLDAVQMLEEIDAEDARRERQESSHRADAQPSGGSEAPR